jgi:UDPglucose 6-dehydrogenase
MTIEVVGAGYVGLVTATCLASLGHSVRCVDVDEERIERLREGFIPFHEPGLDALVAEGVASGRLTFSSDVAAGATGSDMAFIAVGTLDGTGQWTDANVRRVVEELLDGAELPPLLVVRSTLRPGRMKELSTVVERSGRPATLLLHPEFTKEGTAIEDFLRPDRIVVGIPSGADESVADPVRRLYRKVEAPFLVVDHTSAELIKIGSNAFLATKVSFANEFARFCREIGGDMTLVRQGLGLDSRIGPEFLRSGPGFGGSCLPSQIDVLAEMSDELNLSAELIPAIKRLNSQQIDWIVDQVLEQAGTAAPSVAVLGLTFKAGTDDLRESPALKLVVELRRRGAHVTVYDPVVKHVSADPDISVAASLDDALLDADLTLIATEWPEFRQINWGRAAAVMRSREIFDARGAVDPHAASRAGFRVRSLERGDIQPARREKLHAVQSLEGAAA